MVLYTDIETEKKFREFLKRRGYEHGDIKNETAKALDMYMKKMKKKEWHGWNGQETK